MSCTKDDSGKICKSDCNTIKGKFTTMNGEPVPGVKLELKHTKGTAWYGDVRVIAKTTSKADGTYELKFHLKDHEVGQDAEGYFSVLIDDSDLDIDYYIKQDNELGTSANTMDFTIDHFEDREEVVEYNFYIPKKAWITVHLNNYYPQDEFDYFNVSSLYPFGRETGGNPDEPVYHTGKSGYEAFMATEPNNALKVYVAEKENNKLFITRKKNGEKLPHETLELFVPENPEDIEVNFEY